MTLVSSGQISLAGATGNTGMTGLSGATGAVGATGISGNTGNTGLTGNSGQISLAGTTTGQSVDLELGQSSAQQISMNDSNVRTLSGTSAGTQLSFSNFLW